MKSDYLMLLHPSSNRVYNRAATHLAKAELQVFNASVLDERIDEVQEQQLAGVDYLGFTCDALTQSDVHHLSNLSCIFALFKLNGKLADRTLMPIQLSPLKAYNSDLLSILKFAGKTNEQFTKLLLNVTVMASESAKHMCTQRLSLFDPLCGRGTTLNQALMYGYDASGIEIDTKDFQAYEQFINRWLKDNRLKHTSKTTTLRHNDNTQAQRLGVHTASDKQKYKSGDTQKLDVVNADTALAARFFKPKSFDLIVADLPYGVRHANTTDKRLARSPIQLLETALPIWATLLKPGAAIGLSWNTFLAKSDDVADIIEGAGLQVHPFSNDKRFEHRVDQAINRTLIVATRPR